MYFSMHLLWYFMYLSLWNKIIFLKLWHLFVENEEYSTEALAFVFYTREIQEISWSVSIYFIGFMSGPLHFSRASFNGAEVSWTIVNMSPHRNYFTCNFWPGMLMWQLHNITIGHNTRRIFLLFSSLRNIVQLSVLLRQKAEREEYLQRNCK